MGTLVKVKRRLGTCIHMHIYLRHKCACRCVHHGCLPALHTWLCPSMYVQAKCSYAYTILFQLLVFHISSPPCPDRSPRSLFGDSKPLPSLSSSSQTIYVNVKRIGSLLVIRILVRASEKEHVFLAFPKRETCVEVQWRQAWWRVVDDSSVTTFDQRCVFARLID